MTRSLSYLFLLFFTGVPVAAAEWRGITPGSSTRADVVRELGECPAEASQCEFNLPEEDVYITFSGAKTCADGPEGTVLLIERELVNYQAFVDLKLDRRRFKKFDPTWPRKIGYQGYLDDKAGLLLKAFENKIFVIAHIPALTARKVCPTYYRKPRELIEVWVEHAPPVFIDCPKQPLKADKPLILKVWYGRGLSIFLTWTVSGGQILEGQGRRKIVIDTTGLAGQTIEVLVERLDSTMFTSFDRCKVSFEPKEALPR